MIKATLSQKKFTFQNANFFYIILQQWILYVVFKLGKNMSKQS